MITVIIGPIEENQPVESTLNAIIDDSASIEDMRQAWNYILNGTLQNHLRDSIRFECAKRGIDPQEVISEPPSN